jgi:hypothetical protein
LRSVLLFLFLAPGATISPTLTLEIAAAESAYVKNHLLHYGLLMFLMTVFVETIYIIIIKQYKVPQLLRHSFKKSYSKALKMAQKQRCPRIQRFSHN